MIQHLAPSDPASAGSDIPTLDIALPVYNEAAILAASVRRLHRYLSTEFPLRWVITIVDNASTDGTGAIADALAGELAERARASPHQKGRGRALRARLDRDRRPIVAYMDIDLRRISTRCSRWWRRSVRALEVAIGSRLSAGASVRAARNASSSPGRTTSDSAPCSPPRSATCNAASRRSAPMSPANSSAAIEDDAWFFDTELLLLAEHNGLRIHQVPVDWTDDRDSRVNVARTALGDVRGALRLARTFLTGGGVDRRPRDRTRRRGTTSGGGW